MKATFERMEKYSSRKRDPSIVFFFTVQYHGKAVPFEIFSSYAPPRRNRRLDDSCCLNHIRFPRTERGEMTSCPEEMRRLSLTLTFRNGDTVTSKHERKIQAEYIFGYDIGLCLMIENDRPTFEVDLTLNPR